MSDYKTGQATGGHISGQSNEPFSHPAHALSFNEVARQLQTNTTTGLSADEAAQRLIKYGPNNLGKDKGVQPLQILIAQVANAMSAVSPCQNPNLRPFHANPTGAIFGSRC